MLRGRNNQHGFTLIEILLALGLTAGLGLIIAQLTNVSLKSQKGAQTATDYQLVGAQIRTALEDKTSCLKSLSPQDPPGVPLNYLVTAIPTPPAVLPPGGHPLTPEHYVEVPMLYDPNGGSPLLTPGKRFGNLKVERIRLQHIEALRLESNAWVIDTDGWTYMAANANLIVEFRKEDAPPTAPPTVYTLPLNLRLDDNSDLSPIMGCTANLSNGAGWNCPNCERGDIPMADSAISSLEPSGMKKSIGGTNPNLFRIEYKDSDGITQGSVQFDFE